MLQQLEAILPKSRIKSRLIDRVAYASDAGFYHVLPKVVVQPATVQEVQALFALCNQTKVPITFRTGGTSLSGQAITDGILADLSQHWRTASVLNQGGSIEVAPGVIGSWANAYLKKHHRKIGPDPSSIASAMMGGILSNNSSGMCCGVAQNAYHTLQSIAFVLPNGNEYDTAIQDDYKRFELQDSILFAEIQLLQATIRNNQELERKIRAKYLTKNTVGYSLNAFIDFEHPLDVLAHLLIGAEGTLAFISKAVLNTVPDYPFKSTAFLYFPDIFSACKAIVPLRDSGAMALELMDYASLKSIAHIKGVPDILQQLPLGAAALLVEYQDATEDAIELRLQEFERVVSVMQLLQVPEITTDPYKQAFYWKLRKGMFPSVGAVRKQGTTVILEDVAFPVEQLAYAVQDLQQLFSKFDYHNAIIFGHAKDGNLHFVITQAFDSDSEIKRYKLFLDEVVQLVVVKYQGALKAEHGTGRNMAPFVETEWGAEAYQIMCRIKSVVDPNGILNPDVIISNDKELHLKNLKDLPIVEREVDACIECGYCEHKCPSRDLTLTPRRRIVVRRALAQMQANGSKNDYNTLLKQYQYDGLDTCAVDGMCATDCPVDINTGELVKRLRKEQHHGLSNAMANQLAKHFALTELLVRWAIAIAGQMNRVFGHNTMLNLTRACKRILPSFPLWSNQIRASASKHSVAKFNSIDKVVYFPTCINRVMGGVVNEPKDTIQTFLDVAAKAHIEVVLPKQAKGNCCGQAFASKGFQKAYAISSGNTIDMLWEATHQGKWPVVMDLSSCTYTLLQAGKVVSEAHGKKLEQLHILDSVDFVNDWVLTKKTPISKVSNIVLHPVCSLHKLGNHKKFTDAASKMAHQVQVPVHSGCCGMAGDRGFLFPELTKSAVAMEASELTACEAEGYYASSKTCEISLSDQVGASYQSIVYLADRTL